jgi:hypothetical protein
MYLRYISYPRERREIPVACGCENLKKKTGRFEYLRHG